MAPGGSGSGSGGGRNIPLARQTSLPARLPSPPPKRKGGLEGAAAPDKPRSSFNIQLPGREVNPTPHKASSTQQQQDLGEKHVIAMVGLPARGKSYMASKLTGYLSFFHGAVVRIFNLGEYRRRLYGPHAPDAFFSPDNPEGVAKRAECARMAMKDMIDFLFQESGVEGLQMKNVHSGRIGIFDATNSTRERRRWIRDQLVGLPVKLIFIESCCDDKLTVKNNIWTSKVNNQDYKNVEEQAAYSDFRKRIAQYEKMYASLDESEYAWIKLINSGQRVVINNIHGFLPGRIVQFLSNIHATHKPLYLSRHGQSEYNLSGKIGGDSGLTAAGAKYAEALGRFAADHIQVGPDGKPRRTRLWTSSMRRTIDTVARVPHPKLADGWMQMSHRVYRQLDELYAGICDGMTYEEIEETYPEEFQHRKEDKLAYRYPRGESYLDIVSRLEPLVHEMESYRQPLLIVGHQAVLRLVYAYFAGVSREEAPRLSIPLNTVIELTPNAAGDKYFEKRTVLEPGTVSLSDGQQDPALAGKHDPPSH
jgi:broad specificity phosphatase PhoE